MQWLLIKLFNRVFVFFDKFYIDCMENDLYSKYFIWRSDTINVNCFRKYSSIFIN